MRADVRAMLCVDDVVDTRAAMQAAIRVGRHTAHGQHRSSTDKERACRAGVSRI